MIPIQFSFEINLIDEVELKLAEDSVKQKSFLIHESIGAAFSVQLVVVG